MYSDRTDLLAAVDRRLWRDLGFTDPEPDIIPFLPSLVVAWSDGKLGAAEGEALRERAADLSDHLKAWVEERLRYPPGPYFRCQVSHLLAFLATVWPPGEGEEEDWKKEAEEWASELIQEAGWLRRIFGGVSVERKNLQALQKVMEDGGILASDRIWALARGAHAQAEPQRVSALVEDHDQAYQITGILLEGEEERIAVGCYTSVVRDDDLPEAQVAEKLRLSGHLHEPERWVLLKELVNARGRPISDRLRAELKAKLEMAAHGTFEECTLPEMYYLEDALAADARWMSWIPGNIEELHIDRGEVRRQQAPGTFCGTRSKVQASVEQQLVPGPEGLGFRVLSIRTEGRELRLAAPALLREPATPEAVAWIARFLPEMCDPHTQLVLDEANRRWVAEVHSHIPTRCAAPEPLPAGRSLLVPPWIWFRAANALGQRFFAGRRKVAKQA
ncbi:MAG TPA: hypothetical protein PKY30_03790 [Myxococcota bacterium]|nr:hypothetical protein [Myxococcota bacterium]